MIRGFLCTGGRLEEINLQDGAAALREAVWIDLEAPSADELAEVGRATGLAMPSRASLTEIETSSRLAATGNMLTLSMPLINRALGEGPQAAPAGFVLAPDRLVTIRFASSLVFDQFVAQPHKIGAPESAFLFTGLLEAIVDRLADALEKIRDELDGLSHAIFHRQQVAAHRKGQQRREQEAELRKTIALLGRTYDSLSYFRDSQHGIARIAPFVIGAAPWVTSGAGKRLRTVQQDVNSLNEFSNHLTDKVQFLLDATLGLINIAQNNLMKVLTIVSVVGIPPTLVAGIYGMNFRNMPELHWAFGYGYGLVMITLTAILPLVWFRYKGWL
jgi:magnesium transporter